MAIAYPARSAQTASMRGLLRKVNARTPHLLRHILELGLAIADGQHGFLIVHVHTGFELQAWKHGSVNIHKTHGRVVRKQVAAALLAPLSKADGRLVVRADVGSAPGYLQCLRVPQSEGVHRPRGPVPARFTVAITHAGGFAGHFKLHFSTKAAALVDLFATHDASPCNIE